MANPQPVIYLSVVTEELGSIRDRVAKVLLEMGYQSSFVLHSQLLAKPEHRTNWLLKPLFWLQITMGRAVGKSAAMIQLVGRCYGVTLQSRSLKYGPLGTLAAEAQTAKAVGKQVYYIILSDSHPVDGGDFAPPETQARHDAYRQRVRDLPRDVFYSSSEEETLGIVRNLGEKLGGAVKKAGRRQAWLTWLINIGVILTAVGQYLISKDKQWEREAAQKKQQAAYAEARVEVGEMVTSQITGPKAIKPRWESEARARYEAAVKPVAYRHKFREQWLRYSLRNTSADLLNNPNSSQEERIEALHRVGFFLPGRDYAEPALVEPKSPPEKDRIQEALVWIAAAKFNLDCGNYPSAETHLNQALALVNRDHHFAVWSAARHEMGRVLQFKHQINEARDLYRELVALRKERLGPEHPDTLLSRHELGVALFWLTRYDESESELREVQSLQQKVLGAEHADVLRTRMEVARAVGYQGNYFDAERELREVLRVQERTLGPLHPDTLKCVREIAFWMLWLERREGALQYAQRALTGMLQVHGNDHWETLRANKLVRKLSPRSPLVGAFKNAKILDP